ncbi:MAG: hypothetical protein KKH41_00550, partial [Candidatus Thermoplasmatota archaeon]|nr:hypothetical protein [Candidatus Thermoplasmatota archaeon]
TATFKSADTGAFKLLFCEDLFSKLPAPKVAGVCCQGWKFTQGAMHLIYQSLTALISCAID